MSDDSGDDFILLKRLTCPACIGLRISGSGSINIIKKDFSMNTTITIGDGLLILIGLCAVILLFYLIRVVRALLPSLTSLSKILDDTASMTDVASKAVVEAEDAITSLTDSTGDMAQFIAENQSAVKAMVSLVNAIAAIKKLLT